MKDSLFVLSAFVDTVILQCKAFPIYLPHVTHLLARLYPGFAKRHRSIVYDASQDRIRLQLGQDILGEMELMRRWGPLYWFVLYDMAQEACLLAMEPEFVRFFVNILPRILPCERCRVNMDKWLYTNRNAIRHTSPVRLVFDLHMAVNKETDKPDKPLECMRFFTDDPSWARMIVGWLRRP
jgi:hypothetical protein